MLARRNTEVCVCVKGFGGKFLKQAFIQVLLAFALDGELIVLFLLVSK